MEAGNFNIPTAVMMIGSAIGGAAAQFAVEVAFHPVGTLWRRTTMQKSLTARVFTDTPKTLTDVTCNWTSGDQSIELSNLEVLQQTFLDQIRNGPQVLVLTGQYGSGKSSLCRYLASKVICDRTILRRPCTSVLDASRFVSPDITSEIATQIQNAGKVMISLEEIFALLRRRDFVLFIDSLDQIPYLNDNRDTLNAVLQWVRECVAEQNIQAKIVLVVRQELIKVSLGLQKFIDEQKTPILHIRGFTTTAQIRNYVISSDREHGAQRWAKVQHLLETDKAIFETLCVPVLLHRMVAIPFETFKEISTLNLALGKIFRLSFANLDRKDKELLMHLAYRLYTNDQDYFAFGSAMSKLLGTDRDGFSELCSRTGLIVTDGRDHRFAHQSYRDYFAAEYIVSALESDNGATALSSRTMHYLVSEFVAGLLDNVLLLELLRFIDDPNNEDLLKNNALDIVAEVEGEKMRAAATDFISSRCRSFSEQEWTPHRMFLAAVAGVFGYFEPVKALIEHVRGIGLKKFREEFFLTKDEYKYYSTSYDRWLLEWVKILEAPKYGFFRCLVAFIFGELKDSHTVPALRKVQECDGEMAEVKIYATEALHKLTAENPV